MFQSLTTQRRNSERQVLELRSQVAMEQQTSKTNKKGCFQGMEVIHTSREREAHTHIYIYILAICNK